MKNLIVLFFVLFTVSVSAQNKNSEEVAISNEKFVFAKKREFKITKLDIEQDQKKSIKSVIIRGFSTGNVKVLTGYFPANIDVSIVGKSNLYSRSQAEQVLNTFFAKHKVSSFAIVHEGSSGGTKYFIGNYISEKKKYRVTINVKINKGINSIFNITIDS